MDCSYGFEQFLLIVPARMGTVPHPRDITGFAWSEYYNKHNVSFLAMAEASAVSSVSSVVSDRGSFEENDDEYSSLVRPYQYELLAGELTESVEGQLDVDSLSPLTVQDRYENTVTVDSW